MTQLDENHYIITETSEDDNYIITDIPKELIVKNYYSVAYHKKETVNGAATKSTNGIKDWNAGLFKWCGLL